MVSQENRAVCPVCGQKTKGKPVQGYFFCPSHRKIALDVRNSTNLGLDTPLPSKVAMMANELKDGEKKREESLESLLANVLLTLEKF